MASALQGSGATLATLTTLEKCYSGGAPVRVRDRVRVTVRVRVRVYSRHPNYFGEMLQWG